MSGLRGFGFTVTAGGAPRYWYTGCDGISRWSDTDKPVAELFGAHLYPDIAPPVDPVDADEAVEGIAALPELSESELADGDYTQGIC